ncbi:unnamed protein product [Phytophthora lilii]|uniref:Unnamed protein product n=1 Tax=Phytophthora lilii TaxID=2077276 RepID=A0A9W6U864_9STRA|nr:unnamed protein product [Phytophthora lilii]
METLPLGPSVGIDLGTIYFCVGVWRNDHVEIVPTKSGDRLTPSYVAFTENEVLIGEAATHQLLKNRENTVYDITRLIGRKFSDPEVQEFVKSVPFKVVCGQGDQPQVVVQFKGRTKTFNPVEILALFLAEMRDIAEASIGKGAVVPVPAFFNSFQHQATKDAGAIAGIKVLRTIAAPEAAALSYGLDTKGPEKTALIIDFGGGTLHVALVTAEDSILQVLAIAGFPHLGGADFDNRLVQHCVTEFKKIFKKDPNSNTHAMMRLRKACEQTKRTLSALMDDYVHIESL